MFLHSNELFCQPNVWMTRTPIEKDEIQPFIKGTDTTFVAHEEKWDA